MAAKAMNFLNLSRRNFFKNTLGISAAAISWPSLPSLQLGHSDRIEMPHAPLAIGQIGAAHPHADGKLSAMLSAKDDWQVVGWAETDPDLRQIAATKAPYNRVPQLTVEELLQHQGVVALAIETRLDDATEMAHEALRSGKHIHLDKPGGIDHESFVAMHRAAESRGLTVQMGYMLRYNPAFELLFQAVQEGWLGQILEIDAAMGKLADEPTRRLISEQPGGAMFEIGCHLIDIIVRFLGCPDKVEGFNTPSTREGVSDNQCAVLCYPHATAVVRTNFADPFGSSRRRFNVTGTEGSFEITPLESGKIRLSLTQARGEYSKGEQMVELPINNGRYDGEFADLASVIRNQKAFEWSHQHDIDVHATALQAAGIWKG